MTVLSDLSKLGASEQIALLFLSLFGLLLLISAAGVLFSMRDRPEPISQAAQDNWKQFRRDLTATWWGACLFWAAWISGPVGATVLFGVFSFLALREFITLMHTRRADHRSLILAFFVLLPLQ